MSQPRITVPSLVTGIVSCRLCNEKFVNAPDRLLISVVQTNGKNNDVADFCTQLLQHMVTKHLRENLALEMEATQFLSMRRLQNFTLNDPEMVTTIDKLRWQTHNATTAATLSDQAIAGAADQYADKMVDKIETRVLRSSDSSLSLDVPPQIKVDLREILMEMLTTTRQLLQEPNKYPPETTH